MDGFAMGFFLLLGLVPLYNGLTAATSAKPQGCAGPPALCCPGKNSSCYRGCYCDTFCISFSDCCDDYAATCTSVATAPPSPTGTSASAHTSASAASNATASNQTSVSTPAPADNGSTTAPGKRGASVAPTVSDPPLPNTANSSVSAPGDQIAASPDASATAATTATRPSSGSTTATASTTLGTSSTTAPAADGSVPVGVPDANADAKTAAGAKRAFRRVTVHLTASVLSHNGGNDEAVLEAFNKFLSQAVFQPSCDDCTVTIKQIKRT